MFVSSVCISFASIFLSVIFLSKAFAVSAVYSACNLVATLPASAAMCLSGENLSARVFPSPRFLPPLTCYIPFHPGPKQPPPPSVLPILVNPVLSVVKSLPPLRSRVFTWHAVCSLFTRTRVSSGQPFSAASRRPIGVSPGRKKRTHVLSNFRH